MCVQAEHPQGVRRTWRAEGAAGHGARFLVPMPEMSATSSSGTREGSLRLALVVCFFDLCLMGVALMQSNSVTILGDLLKESTDTLSVLAAFLTVRAVRKSPDYRFAYGIGKLENIVYFGTDTHYYVKLDAGESFIIRQQNSHGAGLGHAVGYAVGVALEPRSAQVVRD